MLEKKRLNQLLYLLAFVKAVVPFFLQNGFYQPHRDEFLYLAEGHHLAWGFMEVPPLLSLFAWMTNFMDAGMFWIKIWPALFGAFTFILVGKIVISLGGKTFALILAWLPFMLSGYMRLFFLFQPNFLEVFFYVLITFSLFRYFQTQKNTWLYIFGIATGLGLMSKYSVAFYVAGIMLALILTPWRKLFLNKHFYISLFIAGLIFSPNIIWQYNHKFPVIAHMTELQTEQLKFIGYRDFLAGQLLICFGSLLTWFAGLFFLLVSKKGKPFRVFGFAYFFVIILLMILHGKDYYAMGLYPMLFAFGGYHLEKVTMHQWKWARYLLILFPVLLGLYTLPLTMPLAKPDTLVKYYRSAHLDKTGSFQWEDHLQHPLPQDFGDMFGWKEFAETTAKVYHHLTPEEQKMTLIFCDGYFTAGALNYYRKNFNLPETYSTSASFLTWMPDTFHINNIIFVDKNISENDPVLQQFDNVVMMDSVSIPYFRESGTKVYLLQHAHEHVNEFLNGAVKKMKDKFRR